MNRVQSQNRSESWRGRPVIHTLTQAFVVNIENGMHARPCAHLIKTLRSFRCTVQVEANGEKANGHSILGLMALGAAHGTTMTFTVIGEDALQAMAAISHLFETRFNEAYQTSSFKVTTA